MTKNKVVNELVKGKRDSDISIIENVRKTDVTKMRNQLEKALGSSANATIVVIK